MNSEESQDRAQLRQIAHRVMLERGLLPDFSDAALAELKGMHPANLNGTTVRDLRKLLWCSIDNDDSMDLDQLTVALTLPGGQVKILVAVADVDALVKLGSALDVHAGHNTTSIYTAAEIFPMLPEQLSTDLTSLSFDTDRLAIVIDMTLAADGSVQVAEIDRAWVHNYAKLAYNSLAAWLEGTGPMPEAVGKIAGLAENLHLQDAAAQKMKALRHANGALSLETLESRPVFEGDKLRGLEFEERNRAKDLIEDFMVAANGATARFLAQKNFPSIRRVVRIPKRWDRIVELAQEHGSSLPVVPDSKALENFLTKEKAADPIHFPDLSLAVIKMLGSGEYVTELPGGEAPGHFGLAVKDYAHSTAPNRRYTDLITQRLLKAAIEGEAPPYSVPQLIDLALHCTQEEDAANKVERQVGKSAAALLLEHRIGEHFDSIVTGAADKGTWVRLLSVPVEGRLEQGFQGVDVGDRFRVRLISVDVERGYIDFARENSNNQPTGR